MQFKRFFLGIILISSYFTSSSNADTSGTDCKKTVFYYLESTQLLINATIERNQELEKYLVINSENESTWKIAIPNDVNLPSIHAGPDLYFRDSVITQFNDEFLLYGIDTVDNQLNIYNWSIDAPEKLTKTAIRNVNGADVTFKPRYASRYLFTHRQGNLWKLPVISPSAYLIVDLSSANKNTKIYSSENNITGTRLEENGKASLYTEYSFDKKKGLLSKRYLKHPASHFSIYLANRETEIIPINSHPITGETVKAVAVVTPSYEGKLTKYTIDTIIYDGASVPVIEELDLPIKYFVYDPSNMSFLLLSSNDGRQFTSSTKPKLADKINYVIERDNLEYMGWHSITESYDRIIVSMRKKNEFGNYLTYQFLEDEKTGEYNERILCE